MSWTAFTNYIFLLSITPQCRLIVEIHSSCCHYSSLLLAHSPTDTGLELLPSAKFASIRSQQSFWFANYHSRDWWGKLRKTSRLTSDSKFVVLKRNAHFIYVLYMSFTAFLLIIFNTSHFSNSLSSYHKLNTELSNSGPPRERRGLSCRPIWGHKSMRDPC